MNSTNSTLTKELVNELFTYENGALFWKICPAKNVPAGAKAGYVQGNKYLGITIFRKMYPLHRVIFLYHNGYLPKIVDHIDGDILNNKIENLRAATVATNGANRRIGYNNTSGVKNVSWRKATKKWDVRVQKASVRYYVGSYKTLEEAAHAAAQARLTLHQEFVRHA